MHARHAAVPSEAAAAAECILDEEAISSPMSDSVAHAERPPSEVDTDGDSDDPLDHSAAMRLRFECAVPLASGGRK
jgi:hypothetical protein